MPERIDYYEGQRVGTGAGNLLDAIFKGGRRAENEKRIAAFEEDYNSTLAMQQDQLEPHQFQAELRRLYDAHKIKPGRNFVAKAQEQKGVWDMASQRRSRETAATMLDYALPPAPAPRYFQREDADPGVAAISERLARSPEGRAGMAEDARTLAAREAARNYVMQTGDISGALGLIGPKETWQYDPQRGAYVGITPGGKAKAAVPEGLPVIPGKDSFKMSLAKDPNLGLFAVVVDGQGNITSKRIEDPYGKPGGAGAKDRITNLNNAINATFKYWGAPKIDIPPELQGPDKAAERIGYILTHPSAGKAIETIKARAAIKRDMLRYAEMKGHERAEVDKAVKALAFIETAIETIQSNALPGGFGGAPGAPGAPGVAAPASADQNDPFGLR